MFRILGVVTAILVAVIASGSYWLLYSPAPVPPPHALQQVSIEIGGRERSYGLFAPAASGPDRPLLLVFHGSMGNIDTIRLRTGYRFEAIADREALMVAYPNGVGGYWNGCRSAVTHVAKSENVDDVAFVRRLVDDLVTSGQVDRNRVYALGYSNGGHMAFRLALEAPDLVAGIAVFAANLPDQANFDCEASGIPVRTAIINGTEDPVNPYAGGKASIFGLADLGFVRSARDSAAYFRTLYEASGDGSLVTHEVGRGGTEIEEARRQAVPLVSLVTIVNGGHTVPQSRYRFPRLLGKTLADDEILEYVWRFLRAPRQ